MNEGIETDIGVISGYLVTNRYLVYAKTAFIPYSRYTISDGHIVNGGWDDHNFIGFNWNVGNRISIGPIDLKIEIKNSILNFYQPLKDGAISNQNINQWEIGLGIVKTFANGK